MELPDRTVEDLDICLQNFGQASYALQAYGYTKNEQDCLLHSLCLHLWWERAIRILEAVCIDDLIVEAKDGGSKTPPKRERAL